MKQERDSCEIVSAEWFAMLEKGEWEKLKIVQVRKDSEPDGVETVVEYRSRRKNGGDSLAQWGQRLLRVACERGAFQPPDLRRFLDQGRAIHAQTLSEEEKTQERTEKEKTSQAEESAPEPECRTAKESTESSLSSEPGAKTAAAMTTEEELSWKEPKEAGGESRPTKAPTKERKMCGGREVQWSFGFFKPEPAGGTDYWAELARKQCEELASSLRNVDGTERFKPELAMLASLSRRLLPSSDSNGWTSETSEDAGLGLSPTHDDTFFSTVPETPDQLKFNDTFFTAVLDSPDQHKWNDTAETQSLEEMEPCSYCLKPNQTALDEVMEGREKLGRMRLLAEGFKEGGVGELELKEYELGVLEERLRAEPENGVWVAEAKRVSTEAESLFHDFQQSFGGGTNAEKDNVPSFLCSSTIIPL